MTLLRFTVNVSPTSKSEVIVSDDKPVVKLRDVKLRIIEFDYVNFDVP